MKTRFTLLAAALLALAACTKEPSAGTDANGEAYIQVTVNLPSAQGTKSSTPAEYTEVGKDYENNVTSLKVILKNGSSLLPVTANAGGVTSGDKYTTNPFKVTGLAASTTYDVYVMVNGDETVADVEAAYKTVTSADLSTTIAKPNAFLMTNAAAVTSVTTGADLSVYTKTNPLDAGTISVERAAARFDFKVQDVDSEGDNVYKIGTDNKAVVEIVGMSLMNVSPNFYLFKRVSADGTSTSQVLGGSETATNYVVDYDFANKTKANWATFDASNPYLKKLNGTTASAYTAMTALTTTDNAWTGSGSDPDKVGGNYLIWTYATENTIQADPKVNQINGLTTGVVFKAQIKNGSAGTAFNGTDKVYVFNGTVYGSWAAVVTAKATDLDIQNAFTAVSLSDTEGANDNSMLASAGFTRYSPASDGKYYAYYMYWNRHNDNGHETVMGPMEFAVVRNNVYKLAVDSISKLGHPNDPLNPGVPPSIQDPDPDFPNPENPDEDSNVYMKVAVRVLPWTVRKNNINF